MALVLACAVAAMAPRGVEAKTSVSDRPPLRVGPNETVRTLAQASHLATDGDTIEVQAGDYIADVAVWTQDRLVLRAVNGRVRLLAAGSAAEGKAIWVVRGGRISAEGFDFSGARVADRNGAGIRLEKGVLTVRDCSFTHNENGILTANDPQAVLEVERSEFGYNGHGDGQSHNLYAGTIARLTVTGSYFHHANVGHLLKTRAAVSDIRYNRLTDESGGQASYELEFANGGVAYVIGNVIAQSATTQNAHLISYGIEGYRWPANALYLVNNTLVNGLPRGGHFLRIAPGPTRVKAVNNLLIGSGLLGAGAGDYRNNPNADPHLFQGDAGYEFQLPNDSVLTGQSVDPGADADGTTLRPAAQYQHPRGLALLPAGSPHNPGASQPPGVGIRP